MINVEMKSSKAPHQKKGKVEQLSEVAIKQRMRPLVPRAIERMKELMESRNEAIAMGAVKMVINKFVPDLKVTELQGSEDRPVGVVILPPVQDETTDNMETTPGPAEPVSG